MPALPPFDANGNLPPGDHEPSKLDFEQRFVSVPGSTTRASIYDGWNDHRLALTQSGLPPSVPMILDGSYTTSKRDPGDLDLAVEVPLASAQDQSVLAVAALLQGPKMKAQFRCDAYPIPVYPTNAAEFTTVTEPARAYWRKWFGQDRAGNPKGLVWASPAGFP